MQVVQVDVVGLQTPQRFFALGYDRLPSRPSPIRIAGKKVGEELGRDHRAVALAVALLEEVSDDLLRVPSGIAVSRIDEVPTLFQVVRKYDLGVFYA